MRFFLSVTGIGMFALAGSITLVHGQDYSTEEAWGGILYATGRPVSSVVEPSPAKTPPPGKGVDDRPAETVIRFKRGRTSTAIGGAVARGGRIVYRLEAGAGKTLVVDVASVENNAVFEIYTREVGGRALPGAGAGDEARQWTGRLSESGDYKIVVSSTRGGASYELYVEVR